MNETAKKFLLAGQKFIPELYLKQIGFAYSACGPFKKKNKERIEKFMQTGKTGFIYRNQLSEGCFQHDTAYNELKDLAKITQSYNF